MAVNWEKPTILPSSRTEEHIADVQSVHCSPDPASLIELAELYRTGQERSESVNAIKSYMFLSAPKVHRRARADQAMHD